MSVFFLAFQGPVFQSRLSLLSEMLMFKLLHSNYMNMYENRNYITKANREKFHLLT
jgi:hypothetical protein